MNECNLINTIGEFLNMKKLKKLLHEISEVQVLINKNDTSFITNLFAKTIFLISSDMPKVCSYVFPVSYA